MARAARCAFCAVVAGTTPADRVYEDAAVVAFLDHRPLFPGHILVVPRVHHETMEDLPDGLVGPFFTAVRRLVPAVRTAMGADGTFVAVNNRVSQSVPHLHCHVVPRRPKDGLRGFFWPRTRYASAEERADVASRIAAEVRR